MANRPERLPQPPSAITGELGVWLREVWRAVNNAPTVSYFSGLSPNSVLTGLAGDIAINAGSASTDTRAWIKGGSTIGPSTTSWLPLMVRSFHTFSIRTAASLNSTNMVASEIAASVNVSGASLALRSGNTIYYFTSSASTLA